MRFYQLEAKVPVMHTEEEDAVTTGIKTQWFGTEREAIVERSNLFKAERLAGLKRESLIFPVDVPTDKAGLLTFLRANITGPVAL